MIEFIKIDLYPCIGEYSGQCSLCVEGDRGVFMKHRNGHICDYYDKKWDPNKVVPGDKFEIKFDFIERKSSCYWNGNFIGILDDTLCDKIYPAISISGDHEIECTKWDLLSTYDLCESLLDKKNSIYRKYECKNIESPIDLLYNNLIPYVKMHRKMSTQLESIHDVIIAKRNK